MHVKRTLLSTLHLLYCCVDKKLPKETAEPLKNVEMDGLTLGMDADMTPMPERLGEKASVVSGCA